MEQEDDNGEDREEPPEPIEESRQDAILRLIGEQRNIAEIAKELGVSRQAVWEFCARRGWLGDEALEKIEAKDERRRYLRRVPPPAPVLPKAKPKVGPAAALRK
jgi:predicted transcriptional regulator